MTDVRRPSFERQPKKHVDVLCWTLMPNHLHILAVEKEQSGISNFSKKIFGGYTKYFNEQNDRSGVLFQGKSKKIIVRKEEHFLYLPFYIHMNPLDLFQPKWKEDGIKDVKGAIRFLEEYRWSNYRDIIGKGNGEFLDVTNKELFFEMYETNEKRYKSDLEEWIADRGYRSADFSEFEH
jgi:REP-associated tyrosine transposase